jgi:hypothetical protein
VTCLYIVASAQVKHIVTAVGGPAALLGILEELGTQTLASAALAVPSLDHPATALEPRVLLKLFGTLTTALNDALPAVTGPVPTPPATGGKTPTAPKSRKSGGVKAGLPISFQVQ